MTGAQPGAPAHRWALLLASALALTGCQRCGAKTEADPEVGDAGAAAAPGDGGSAPVATSGYGALRATDLRAALLVLYPEFRGTRVTGGRAEVHRTFEFEGALTGALRPKLTAWPQAREADAGMHASRPPFELEARRLDDGRARVAVWIPLDEETVQKLFRAPAPLGSENLSLFIPRLEGAKNAEETFVMELRYTARPDRARFLIRQLADLLKPSGWRLASGELPEPDPEPDAGGSPPAPSTETDLVLKNEDIGGEIAVRRREGAVRLVYTQPLRPH